MLYQSGCDRLYPVSNMWPLNFGGLIMAAVGLWLYYWASDLPAAGEQLLQSPAEKSI